MVVNDNVFYRPSHIVNGCIIIFYDLVHSNTFRDYFLNPCFILCGQYFENVYFTEYFAGNEMLIETI